MSVLVSQINELGVCLNLVIWRLFSHKKWESVKCVLLFRILVILRKIIFYKHMFYQQIMGYIFCLVLHWCSYTSNNILLTVFMLQCIAA